MLELFHLCWLGGNGFGAAKIILFFRCATTALQEFSPHPGLSLFAHRIPPVGPPQIAHFSRISSPLPPLLQLSLAFLLPLSVRRGEHRELSTQSSPFFIQSSPFSCIYSRVLPRASHSTPALCHSLHFSSPSAVGDRSETHKFHLLMHTSSDAGVPFPLRCRKVQSFLTTMRPSPRLLASFAFKILLQLVHSLLTRPSSPIASSANFLSPWSSTRLFPHLSETHLRDMTQKLTIRTIIRCLSSHFAIQILPLSCIIRRTLQKCEEKAWRIGIKALALPKDDRKLGCLNVNNVQSAVRNRQNRLSPDPQA